MTVTNVKVTFGRQVKPADYENANAIVEIGAIVEDGQDYQTVINEISAVAKNKALELVGKIVGVGQAGTSTAPAQPGSDAAAPAPTTRRRGPKTADTTNASASPATAPGSAAGIADVVDEPPGVEDTGDPTTALVDDDFLAGAPEAAKPITDQELNEACGKVNKRLGGTPETRARILQAAAPFVPEGKKKATLSSIPQDKRAAYIAAIDLLK